MPDISWYSFAILILAKHMSLIPWLDDDDLAFPEVCEALNEPNGLLAAGGDLSCQRLVEAYKKGIFPWFEEDQPILWWSPDPRSIVKPKDMHISRSLKKAIRKNKYKITYNRDFEQVIAQCANLRMQGPGTWITLDMHQAYCELHQMGIAHSVETWLDDELIGGLYGLNIGQVFFGESMFSTASNGSKIAFAALNKQLQEWGINLIDCQVHNPHLASMGATEIPREDFIKQLKTLIDLKNTATWNQQGGIIEL